MSEVPQGYVMKCCPKVVRTLDYLRTKYPKEPENKQKILKIFLTDLGDLEPISKVFFDEIIKNCEYLINILEDGPSDIEKELLIDSISSYFKPCPTMDHKCSC